MSLEDKDSIREILAQYCTYGDNGRSKELAALFTPDGVWEGRMGRADGRDAIETLMARINAPPGPGLPIRRHIVTNSVVAIEGNSAVVTSSFVMFREAEHGPQIGAVGHYDDVFVKDGRAWRIKTRKVTPDIMLKG